MTLTELQNHKLYRLCNEREQVFLETYLKTKGDIGTAIQVAFPKVKNLDRYATYLQSKDTLATLLAILDEAENPTDDAIRKLVFQAMRKSRKPRDVFKGAEILKRYPNNDTPTPEDLREKARRLDNNG